MVHDPQRPFTTPSLEASVGQTAPFPRKHIEEVFGNYKDSLLAHLHRNVVRVRQPEVGGEIVAGMNQVGSRDGLAQDSPDTYPFGPVAPMTHRRKTDEFEAVATGRRGDRRSPSAELRRIKLRSGDGYLPDRITQTLKIPQPQGVEFDRIAIAREGNMGNQQIADRRLRAFGAAVGPRGCPRCVSIQMYDPLNLSGHDQFSSKRPRTA